MRLLVLSTLFIASVLLPLTVCEFSLETFLDGWNLKCNKSQFKCTDGTCLPSKSVCNGVSDCSDGLDEIFCEWSRCENPNLLQCNNKCISLSSVCNGIPDCSGGEDEKNCGYTPSQELCPPKHFRCGSGSCIPSKWYCDGKKDCSDGSDEITDCTVNVKCEEDEFKCKNSKCIPKIFRCDGSKDCEDNSDEENCKRDSVDVTKCGKNKFVCKDKLKCIEFGDTCNKKVDCFDGSDETTETCAPHTDNVHECANCSHHCVYSVMGYLCICPPGHALQPNNSCTDINECETYGICDQKCTNTPGSYNCSCDTAFTLQDDKHTCKINHSEALLLYSVTHEIKGLFLESLENFTIIDNLSHTTRVTAAGRYIYWAVIKDDSPAIMRAAHDGSQIEPIIISGLGLPEDIAVDFITMNVYFTDSKNKFVGVCSKDGDLCTVLHNENIDKPRALSLSPKHGYMFWTDWGKHPLIARSGMDGSKVITLVSENVFWPNGIVADVPVERLYWIEAKLQTVETIKFDGTDRRIILDNLSMHPFSITVFENTLFWSDFLGEEILSCNKFNGRNRQTVAREPSQRISGLHIHHHLLPEASIINPCKVAPCTDLCLITPSEFGIGYTCACPDGKILARNGYQCVLSSSPHTLIAAVNNRLFVIEYQTLGHSKIQDIPLPVNAISAITYDNNEESVIMFDLASQVLYSYNLREKVLAPLPSYGVSLVHSLHYDDIGNNIYWCDWFTLTVEAMSLKTYSRTLIVGSSSMETPYDIALAPDMDYLFVSFIVMYNRVEIHRFSMSGSVASKTLLLEIDSDELNIKIHYSRELKRLFIINSQAKSIESIDVNGKDRRIFEGNQNADILISSNRMVFWTSYHSNLIFSKIYDRSDVEKNIQVKYVVPSDAFLKLATVTSRRNVSESPCIVNNGGCSDICLVSHQSLTKKICACPSGLSLSVDDLKCVKPKICSHSEYECFTGECISINKLCDGHEDCVHGDDERKLFCGAATCTPAQFLCRDKSKCVDNIHRCDGTFECPDKSDEICNKNCTIDRKKFWCDSGECIDIRFRCDTKVDCRDGHDELNCHEVKCSELDFRCSSGQCIPKEWECDMEPDCVDGSDESANCTAFKGCFDSEFLCDNNKCVHLKMRCNKVDDCGDGSDEADCEKEYEDARLRIRRKCNPHTEFYCPTSRRSCLPIHVRCNGTVECPGGHDEQNCTTSECIIGEEFYCEKSKKCISWEWVCDDANDCGDNSDETVSACLSKVSQGKKCSNFRCTSGECLSFLRVCDNIPDCKDRSDEGKQCGIPCEKFGCQYKCIQTPTGPQCLCPNGFTLDKNNKTCVDIDECYLNLCSQRCENFNGSFKCSCFNSDYVLRTDRVSCKARGSRMIFVVASDVSVNIFSNNLRHKSGLRLETNLFRTVRGIDVDNANKTVFILMEDDNLWRVPLNLIGKADQMLLPEVTSFVYDWITQNIYYIQNHLSIKLTTWNASSSIVLVETNTENYMYSLAIDAFAGYLFWFETHKNILTSSGSIVRADTSGANNITLVSALRYGVRQLVVDSYGKHIYWMDRSAHSVHRINYDGTNGLSFYNIDADAVTFTFFENSIYWVTRQTRKFGVKKCNIYGLPPHKCETMKMNVDFIHYLTIIQDHRQRLRTNPCHNVQCSGFCVAFKKIPFCKNFDGTLTPIFGSKIHERVDKVDNGVGFGTIFAYFVILCMSIGVATYLYIYYFKPKSNISRRFHFHNPIYDKPVHSSSSFTEPPSVSKSSSICFENPLAQQEEKSFLTDAPPIQKTKVKFLDTAEELDSKINSTSCYETSMEALINI